MAIIGPESLPSVLKLRSDPFKFEALATLGHPVVYIEIEDSQLEQAIRTSGDFMAGYFPLEEKVAFFNTKPLVSEYPLNEIIPDGYWVREVWWDPVTTQITDIFGAESFLFNIGNITGIQNILTDFHLLQAYRKFSQRILGTEGHWEVRGDNLLRIFPTPRGTFPVLVKYFPVVTSFRSPVARDLTKRMLVANLKVMVGHARNKFTGGIPSPDGGTISFDGSSLVEQGTAEQKEIVTDAILLTEPLGVYIY